VLPTVLPDPGTSVDGSGLGLPIVEIARWRSAEIKIEDAGPVPPGTRVSVRFVLSEGAISSLGAAEAQAAL
jgi:hypothetical protein